MYIFNISRSQLLYALFLLKMSTIAASDFNWCSDQVCGPTNKHTMCSEYYKPNGGDLCKDDKQGLSEEEKKLILDEHNKYRSKVAMKKANIPPASNMMEMEWFDELAQSAQVWANQCKETAEDKCRVLKTGEAVGQAFEYQETDTLVRDNELRRLMGLWFNESEGLDEKLAHKYQKRKLKEFYSMMLWAKTYKIGCGLSVKLKEDGTKTLRLVCNYYPKGAIRGEQVYRVGKACTGCPTHAYCASKQAGLCRYRPDSGSQPATSSAVVLIILSLILSFFIFPVLYLK